MIIESKWWCETPYFITLHLKTLLASLEEVMGSTFSDKQKEENYDYGVLVDSKVYNENGELNKEQFFKDDVLIELKNHYFKHSKFTIVRLGKF